MTSKTSETSSSYEVEALGGQEYNVTWRVSLWPDMSILANEGVFHTTYERDWTVKVRTRSVCSCNACFKSRLRCAHSA